MPGELFKHRRKRWGQPSIRVDGVELRLRGLSEFWEFKRQCLILLLIAKAPATWALIIWSCGWYVVFEFTGSVCSQRVAHVSLHEHKRLIACLSVLSLIGLTWRLELRMWESSATLIDRGLRAWPAHDLQFHVDIGQW